MNKIGYSCIILFIIIGIGIIPVFGDETPTGDSDYQLIQESELPVVRDPIL